MKWFFMSGPGGTIAIKARFPNEAKAEAAERWSCDAAEIVVTDSEPYIPGPNGGE